MGGEGSIAVPTAGTVPVRTLTVTTLIDGVATDVRMQVLQLSDAEGRILVPVDLEMGQAQLRELQAMRVSLDQLVDHLLQ